MKILITGGSGFIGSHLFNKLMRANQKVFILRKNGPKKYQNEIVGDITDRKKMNEIVPEFNMVYHLAGILGTSELIDKSHEASNVNILGTVNILDAAKKNKTKVIYITKPNCWLNTYSITKYAGESFAKMYHQEFGLPTISVKWFNVYGPNQSFHCQKAVPFFIRWALNNQPIIIWGNGNQTVDLIYVSDTVEATVMIAEKSDLNGQTIDIGSGKETTINDLARLIIKLTNSKSIIKHLPMRPGETENTRLKADTQLITKLGFKCKVDLEEGLLKTIVWYRKNI